MLLIRRETRTLPCGSVSILALGPSVVACLLFGERARERGACTFPWRPAAVDEQKMLVLCPGIQWFPDKMDTIASCLCHLTMLVI